MIFRGKKTEQSSTQVNEISQFLYQVYENQLISQANYSAHAGNVERVQYYASVDARKRLKFSVAGKRYKPVCSVDG